MKELITDRLKLRKLEASDYYAIYHNYASDKEVVKYLTWDTHKSLKETEDYVRNTIKEYEKNECYRWAICLIDSNEVIGMIDVVEMNVKVPVIGYVLSKKFWSKHLMSEALDAVCNYLFELGYPAIEGRCDLENLGSERVMLNNGFIKAGENTLMVKNKPRKIAYFILNNV